MSNNNETIYLLLIDADKNDYQYLKQVIKNIVNSNYQLDWVTDISQEFLSRKRYKYSAYIISINVEDYDYWCRQLNPLPVILIGDKSPSMVNGLKEGIGHYIPFNELNSFILDHCLRLCIAHSKTKIQLKEYQQNLSPSLNTKNKTFQTKEILEVIFEKSTDGVLVLDENGVIIFANYATSKMLSQSFSNLIGSCFGIPVFEDNYTEIQVINPQGNILTLEISYGETRWENTLAYVVILRDITEKKRQEEELAYFTEHLQGLVLERNYTSQESEQIFRQLAENINSVFWVISAEAKEYIYLSPAYEKITGLSCERMYENPDIYLDLIHPEDKDNFIDQSINLPQEFTEFEYRIINIHGDIKWLKSRCFPVFNQNGKLVRLVGVWDDITENKLFEIQLKQQKEKYQAILKTSFDGVWILDVSQEFPRLLEVNDAYCQLSGYSREELLSLTVMDLELNLTPEVIKTRLNTVMTTGGMRFECQHQTKQGNIIDLFLSINYVSGFNLVVAFLQDITEQKRNKNALIRANREMETIFEALPDLFLKIDLNGVIVDYKTSSSFAEFYLPPEHFLNKTIDETLPENLCELTHSAIALCQKTGELIRYDYVLEVNNKLQHYEARISLVSDNLFLCNIRNINEQKQAQIALEESKAILQSVLENVPSAIIRYRQYPDGVNEIKFMNSSCVQLWEVSEEEVEKDVNILWDMIHPDDFEMTVYSVNQAVNNLTSWNCEYRIITPSGKEKWVQGIGKSQLQIDNTVISYTLIIDISDRKLKEKALLEANKKLEYLFHIEKCLANISRHLISNQKIDLDYVLQTIGTSLNASRVYLILTQEEVSNFQKINEWCDKDVVSILSHWEKIEIYGLHWLYGQLKQDQDVNISEDNPAPKNAVGEKEILQLSKVNSFTASPIFDKYNQFWGFISLDASYDNQKKFTSEDNQFLRVLGGMIYNYCDRILANQKLEEKEKRLRAIFEQAAAGIAISSISGIFEEVNQKWADFFGYSREEMTKINCQEITYPEDLLPSLKNIEKILLGQINSFSMDKRYLTKKGEIKWGNLTCALVRNYQGKPSYFISVLEDIEARKKTEFMLTQAKQSAEEASKAKSMFLANMSHELRTPLNAILGFSQLMQSGKEMPPQYQDYINTINQAGEHLLSVINNILDISKIESGKTYLNLESFNIYSLLDSLKNLFMPQIVKKNISLSITTETNIPQFIKADLSKVRSILINLIGNAIKFTPQGSIEIKVSHQEINSKINLIFRIKDTGIGIPSEQTPKLFQMFVQGKAGEKQGKGSGLGLAISKSFINLMNGDIQVVSELNKGTTFTFNIMVEAVTPLIKPCGDTETTKTEKISLSFYRILIIEDNATNRKLLYHILTQKGFSIEEAVNGKEGIEKWQQWQPHLIIMDIKMPIMDGYKTIQQIRQKELNYSSKVKIITFTGNSLASEREKCLSYGSDDVLIKPLKIKELWEKLSLHLGINLDNKDRNKATFKQVEKTSSDITSADLLFMGDDWKSDFYNAALRGRKKIIYSLIEKIPLEYDGLIRYLTSLTDNLNFEKIISLTK